MVPRQAFINKIRELGFTFKGEKKRVTLWRQKGTFLYIAVPKSDLLEDEFVTSSLRRAGLEDDEIRKFIGEARA